MDRSTSSLDTLRGSFLSAAIVRVFVVTQVSSAALWGNKTCSAQYLTDVAESVEMLSSVIAIDGKSISNIVSGS